MATTPKKLILIGLAGKRRAGKSMCAEFLCKNYGFIELSMAHRLKLGVSSLFGWTTKSMDDPALKEVVDPMLGFSRRKAMQVVGTLAREELNPQVWLTLLEMRIDELSVPCPRIVIPDIRFENEAFMIRNRRGILIHVNAEDRLRESMDPEVDSHVSEHGVIFRVGDIMIDGNGTKEQTLEELDKVAPRIGLF